VDKEKVNSSPREEEKKESAFSSGKTKRNVAPDLEKPGKKRTARGRRKRSSASKKKGTLQATLVSHEQAKGRKKIR